MSVRKLNAKTKDGRSWVFECRYKNYEGNIKQAKEREMIFIMEQKEIKERKIMTFKELYELFFLYQKSRVKNTTLYNYSQKIKYFKNIENVKLHEITISTYNYWRNSLNQTKLGDSYKNDILKFFKELLKFAEKMYDYDFRKLYNKFDKFRNPNEIIDKSFDYYTLEEYTKFIAQEKELKYIVAFDLLYYCGLRRGELLGLT